MPDDEDRPDVRFEAVVIVVGTAATYAVEGLQYQYLEPLFGQQAGAGEATHAGSDNQDIVFCRRSCLPPPLPCYLSLI